MAGWVWETVDSFGHVHVHPVADLVDHEIESDDCICGPRIDAVKREDGSIGWLVVHHSLDGREQHERAAA